MQKSGEMHFSLFKLENNAKNDVPSQLETSRRAAATSSRLMEAAMAVKRVKSGSAVAQRGFTNSSESSSALSCDAGTSGAVGRR